MQWPWFSWKLPDGDELAVNLSVCGSIEFCKDGTANIYFPWDTMSRDSSCDDRAYWPLDKADASRLRKVIDL
jgi:hypothetical protein